MPAIAPGPAAAITFGLADQPVVLSSFVGSHPVRANTPWAVPSHGTWRVAVVGTTDLRLVHCAGLPLNAPAGGGRPIKFDGPQRQVLRGAIKSLCDSDHDSVAAFVMMATWALEHGRPAEDQRLERVIEHIDEHLRDPALTTASIATRSRISRRTLQSLFTVHGGLATHIRRQRLAAVLRDLVADPDVFPDLDAVAQSSGLGSRRTLERAMRQVYGMTPRQARAHVLAGGVLREPARAT